MPLQDFLDRTGQIKSENHGIYMPLQDFSDRTGQIKSESHGIYMPLQDFSDRTGQIKSENQRIYMPLPDMAPSGIRRIQNVCFMKIRLEKKIMKRSSYLPRLLKFSCMRG